MVCLRKLSRSQSHYASLTDTHLRMWAGDHHDWLPAFFFCPILWCLMSTRPHVHALCCNIGIKDHLWTPFQSLSLYWVTITAITSKSKMRTNDILNCGGSLLNSHSSQVTGGCTCPLLSATLIIYSDVLIRGFLWAAAEPPSLCMYGGDKDVNYRREVPQGGWRSRAERDNLGSTTCPTITTPDKEMWD